MGVRSSTSSSPGSLGGAVINFVGALAIMGAVAVWRINPDIVNWRPFSPPSPVPSPTPPTPTPAPASTPVRAAYDQSRMGAAAALNSVADQLDAGTISSATAYQQALQTARTNSEHTAMTPINQQFASDLGQNFDPKAWAQVSRSWATKFSQ
jgi:hypothetical protein